MIATAITRAAIEAAQHDQFETYNQVKTARREGSAADVLHRVKWKHRLACDTLLALQKTAVKQFAQARGWGMCRPFTLEQLRDARCRRGWREWSQRRDDGWPIIDHAEYFCLNRRPVALLTHSYRTDVAAHCAFGNQFGLLIDVLGFSWWNPAGCVAVLYSRPGLAAAHALL